MNPQHSQNLLRSAVARVPLVGPTETVGVTFGKASEGASPTTTPLAPTPVVDEIDDDEFIRQVVPATTVFEAEPEDDDAVDGAGEWLERQRQLAAEADAARAATRGRRQPDELDNDEPTVRATSAGGRYDDGVPERSIANVEREEVERLAAVEKGDAEEAARIARVRSRLPSIAASISRGSRVPNEKIADEPRTPAAASSRSSGPRPVRCVDDGHVFGSTTQAAASIDVTPSKLKTAIKLGKKCKGKRWQWADGPAAATSGGHCRAVVCVDPFRVFLTETAACEAVQVAKGAVRSAIKTGGRAGGYHWRDATPEEIAIHIPARDPSLKADRVRPPAARIEAAKVPEPVVMPVLPTVVNGSSDLFLAKAMLALGRSGAVMNDADVVESIVQARRLDEARRMIQAIEQGGALTTIDPWAKAGA